MKKIGILGSGIVGRTLADGFIKNGYHVKIGTAHPAKLNEWSANAGENGSTGSFIETAEYGDVIVLAIKGRAAKDVLIHVEKSIDGKIIVDTTNPIDENSPPEQGVLRFFTESNRSLMEDLQESFPNAHFVKAFNSVGAHLMVNPQLGVGLKPSMFICGDNENAKKEVIKIIDLFGWEAEDMGFVQSARAIESLCMLWCIPGMLTNQWIHAFKLLK